MMTSVILKFLTRKDSAFVETVLQVLQGLVRVLGAINFSNLSKSEKFWSPMIHLIQTSAASPGLIKLLDSALSSGTQHGSETDLKMVFALSSVSSNTLESIERESRKSNHYIRHNFQSVASIVNQSIPSLYDDEAEILFEPSTLESYTSSFIDHNGTSDLSSEGEEADVLIEIITRKERLKKELGELSASLENHIKLSSD